MISALMILITFLVLGIPTGIVLCSWTYLSGNVMPLYHATQWIAQAGMWMGGIRIEVVGLDRIPKDRACIFMSNHVSNLDPPVLLPKLPGRTSALLKKSLMKIPFLGYGMRKARFIPVERSGSVEGAKESIRLASEVLADGIHISIFVEGTRSRDGWLLPFKKGPFFLAMETGAPCVPVSISGTEKMMRKGGMKVYPGTARIEFHPPLDPHQFENREELMLAVRSAIASGLPEWMRGDAEKK
jgi:1-acyl-sn-glycerol-3-phosphate acyltransferase